MTTLLHAPSRACYLRGCRQAECIDANRRFCKRYRLDRLQNGPRRVDAEPARLTVQRYIAAGWSYSAIAKLARCSETVIVDLTQGAPRLNPTSARCIASLPPAPPGIRGGACTEATGTIRRGRALACIGHEDGAIAAALGMHPDTLTRILNRDHGLVLVATATAMTALYAQWSHRPGSSQRARNRAKRKGWHGPLSWDDNIDDPAAKPDTDGTGYQPPPKRDDLRPVEIEHLARFGFSEDTIAKQVGLPVKDVHSRLLKMRAKAATKKTEAAAA